MNINESMEDYLETILILLEEKDYVRSMDVVKATGFSKPSISIAMKKLKDKGYINMDDKLHITLTAQGRQIAESTYNRHKALSKMLMLIGVNKETALKDACKIEHEISEETFDRIKDFVEKNELAS